MDLCSLAVWGICVAFYLLHISVNLKKHKHQGVWGFILWMGLTFVIWAVEMSGSGLLCVIHYSVCLSMWQKGATQHHQKKTHTHADMRITTSHSTLFLLSLCYDPKEYLHYDRGTRLSCCHGDTLVYDLCETSQNAFCTEYDQQQGIQSQIEKKIHVRFTQWWRRLMVKCLSLPGLTSCPLTI